MIAIALAILNYYDAFSSNCTCTRISGNSRGKPHSLFRASSAQSSTTCTLRDLLAMVRDQVPPVIRRDERVIGDELGALQARFAQMALDGT